MITKANQRIGRSSWVMGKNSHKIHPVTPIWSTSPRGSRNTNFNSINQKNSNKSALHAKYEDFNQEVIRNRMR